MPVRAGALACLLLLTVGACSASSEPPDATATTGPAATTATGTERFHLTDGCHEVSSVVADLDVVPDASDLDAAGTRLKAFSADADRGTSRAIDDTISALAEERDAKPGDDYLSASGHLLDALDALDETCLAVGSDALY